MARVCGQRKTPDLLYSRDVSLLQLPGSGATPLHYAPQRPKTGQAGSSNCSATAIPRPGPAPTSSRWRPSTEPGPAAWARSAMVLARLPGSPARSVGMGAVPFAAAASQSGSGWWLCRAPDLAESFRLADKAAAGQGTRVILGHGHAGQLPAASSAVPRGRAIS